MHPPVPDATHPPRSGMTETTLPPSKVIHARNIDPDYKEDLLHFLDAFGSTKYVVILPRFQQALIELDSITSAMKVIEYSKEHFIGIRDKQIILNYSKSQHINREAELNHAPSTQDEHHGEHTLLITVYNPLYPITVEVLQAILCPHGQLQRVVIFHKNGIQALAEFSNPSEAVAAKEALDGKDIYDECCSLRVVYSVAERLNVRFNDMKTRDFTNDSLPTSDPNKDDKVSAPLSSLSLTSGGNTGPHDMPGSVLLLHDLPPNITCDMLFNLFCLYGNVIKVKLLPESRALIQMADKISADTAIINLNKVHLFNHEMDVSRSKHAYIAESRSSNTSSDNPTSKDYSDSYVNRFSRHQPGRNNHMYRPTSVLHFSNAGNDFTSDTLHEFFHSLNIPAPSRIKFFDAESKTLSGLIEFQSESDAILAVCLGNNVRFNHYTLKLAFSVKTVGDHTTRRE